MKKKSEIENVLQLEKINRYAFIESDIEEMEYYYDYKQINPQLIDLIGNKILFKNFSKNNCLNCKIWFMFARLTKTHIVFWNQFMFKIYDRKKKSKT